MVDPKSDERRTPLFMAAENGAFDAVKLLMERGADVTIRDTELRSVLHAAVGHPRVMETLLQVKGIKPTTCILRLFIRNRKLTENKHLRCPK